MAAHFSMRRSGSLMFLNLSKATRIRKRIISFSQCGLASDSHSTANVNVNANAPEVSSVGYASSEKVQKVSKAMRAYLERAKAHNAFMAEEIAEFEIGKRHLANMMGADPDMLTQEDVDKAIEYLLPSGLFDKKARPKLKHPEEILPKRKAAQFGLDGRPFDYLFYTGKPKFYQMLHELAVKLEELKKLEDTKFAKGVKLDSIERFPLVGGQWVEKKMLEKKYQEKLSDTEYKQFLALIELVAKQTFAMEEKDYLLQFRYSLQAQLQSMEVPPPLIDESGRSYQIGEGKRKRAKAIVKLYDKGSGKFRVNNSDLLGYFPRLADREQIIFPLHLTDRISSMDFDANTEGGGPSGQAGAIRLGLSLALRSFVDKETMEKMRLAGLLTHDPRYVERQKPGQQGARRKYTWKKR